MRRINLLVAACATLAVSLPAIGQTVPPECDRDCATVCTDIHDPSLLLPDLVSLPPASVRVTRQGTHRVVLFTSSPANIGDGPLIVHGTTVDGPNGPVTIGVQEIFKKDGSSCIRDAGTFEYHPSHHHFHVDDFASYQLRKDDPLTGATVAESTKVSFCLLDIAPLRGFYDPRVVMSDCLNQQGTQGISVGFADVYDWFLPGQSIDLDADPQNPVPGGQYYLVNIVNADGIFWEKDDSLAANIGFTTVKVPEGRILHTGPPQATPTATLPAQPPPTATQQPQQPPPTATPTASSARGPHAPHSPHQPWLGPRPRLPHLPHLPHSPLHQPAS